jgi:hypothetical protein
MDGRNDKPVPPWEQEQAAAALAELTRANDLSARDDAALKLADPQLMLAEVDRMIADKKFDLERMQRLDQTAKTMGGDLAVPGLRYILYSLDKPGCIVVLLVLIVAMGIALRLMANSLASSIDTMHKQQQAAPAAGSAFDFTNPANDESELKQAGVDDQAAADAAQDEQQQSDDSQHPVMP